jgi:hypothetical protein
LCGRQQSADRVDDAGVVSSRGGVSLKPLGALWVTVADGQVTFTDGLNGATCPTFVVGVAGYFEG